MRESATAIVTISRPALAPDEQAQRIRDCKKALADFWVAYLSAKQQKATREESIA